MTGRNHEVTIKVNQEELRKLREQAEKISLPISTFCRMICIKATIKPIEDQ